MRAFLVFLLAAAGVARAAEGRLDEAERASRNGKFTAAAAAFREEIARDACSGRARLGLVTALIQSKDVDGAVEAAEQGAAACPQSAGALAALGDARFRSGRFSAAETAYKGAIRLDGKLARAWWGFARVCAASGLRAQARRHFENAYRLDPDDPDVVRSYARSRLQAAEEIAGLERYLALAEHRDPDVTRQTRYTLKALRAEPDLEMRLDPSSCQTCEVPMPPLVTGPGPRNRHGWGVDVRINGGKPLRVMLDTGASGLAIDPKTAEKWGVRRVAAWETRGLGDEGARAGWLGLADRVRVGEVELRNVMVSVAALQLGDGVRGLAGTILFADYRVTLDFARGKVALARHEETDENADGRTTAAEGETRVYGFGHMLLVPTAVNRKAGGLFLVDTGAWDILLASRFAKQVGRVRSSGLIVKGVEGEVAKVQSTDTAELEFAGFRYPGERAVTTDLTRLSHSVGVEFAGLIGRTVLDRLRLTIDYRNYTIRFEKGR